MGDFSGQLITVRADRPRQLVYAGHGPTGLFNRDLTGLVFLGTDEGMSAGGNDLGVIDPLGSMVLDGEADVWALTASGTAVVNAVEGATGWQPSPAQVAAQINALGLAKDTTVQNVHTDLALGTNPFLAGSVAGALVGTPGNTVAKEVGATGLNASVPQKIATGGTYGVNTAWAEPAAVTYPLGAAYEIIFRPQVAASTFWTDVQVDHLDGSGTLVWRELFSISNWSNTALTGGTSASPGCLIRGNLHGQAIKLSGLTASNANYLTVFGAGTNTGISITYYSQSYPTAEPRPKVAALVSTGFLAFMPALSLAATTTFNYGIIPAYCGRCFLNVRAPGGGSGAYLRVISLSVIGGTTGLYTVWSNEATALTTITGPQELALDQLLHQVQLTNPTPTAGIFDASLIAADFI